MLLLTHIIIALTSAIYSVFVLFNPSPQRLRTSKALIGLTIASGTALVIYSKSALVPACQAGLLFTGFSLAGLIAARRRLEAITQKADDKF